MATEKATADTPKLVTVEAIKYHTNAGEEYQVGDTYDVEESAVDNLAHQGMALRVDRADVAKAAAKAAKSTPVEPMGIDTTQPAKRGRPAKAAKAGRPRKAKR